uniref:(northern house mosquito) hypothetical protein n=1 Tax=Culex pipiens TaxID=7175 RepID=A0A8D8CJ10_CULPI
MIRNVAVVVGAYHVDWPRVPSEPTQTTLKSAPGHSTERTPHSDRSSCSMARYLFLRVLHVSCFVRFNSSPGPLTSPKSHKEIFPFTRNSYAFATSHHLRASFFFCHSSSPSPSSLTSLIPV